MVQLQTPYQRDKPASSNRGRRRSWLKILSILLVVAGVGYVALRGPWPTWLGKSVWWEGLHTNAEGKPIPRLHLRRDAKSKISGELDIMFTQGFNIRLPIMDGRVTGPYVTFAVEDPSSLRDQKRFRWFVLAKSGERSSKLYQLTFQGLSPSAGQMIPANLDQEHVLLAQMTSQAAASE